MRQALYSYLTQYGLRYEGLYYGITIAIVSLATAMTVVTLNIHHKGTSGREVPTIVKKVCFRFLARLLCIDTGELNRPIITKVIDDRVVDSLIDRLID